MPLPDPTAPSRWTRPAGPSTPHLVLAGGGTGGHLFPMLAVAHALAERLTDLKVSALCSSREIDARVLDGVEVAGRPIRAIPLPAAPLVLTPAGLCRLLRGWGPSCRAARGLFAASREAGNRLAVLTTSGFVAPPVVWAARRAGVPILALNLDDPPGKATRWIAGRVTERLDATLTRAAGDGWQPIGPIVRSSAVGPAAAIDDPDELERVRGEAKAALGMAPDRPLLVVVGGSQGAATIDTFMMHLARHAEGRNAMAGWQVLHQASSKTHAGLVQHYTSLGGVARVVTFLPDMGTVWSAADLVLARAGAGCVAEVWANRVPTLFMPYPLHRDQHQKRNAAPLVHAGLALVGEDQIDGTANAARNGPTLMALMADAGRRAAMRASVPVSSADAGAQRAADALVRLLDG
jgi:UDP-N-acetylglucosamine--N-acetylmuramyl-(pentapeptide) pyrophosphoryl-undecaprenol N-acetylglucosamine transferase